MSATEEQLAAATAALVVIRARFAALAASWREASRGLDGSEQAVAGELIRIAASDVERVLATSGTLH